MLELKSSTMPHAFGCLTASSDSGDRRLWSCGSSSSSSGSGRSGVNSPASSSSLSPSSPCSPTGPSGAPTSQHHFSRSDVPSTFPTQGAYSRFTYPGIGGVLGLAANGHLDSFDHPDLNIAAANELFKMDQDRLRQRQAAYNNNILPPTTAGSNNNNSERSSTSSPSPTTSPPQGAAQIASELYRLFLSPPPLIPETASSSTPYPTATLNRSVPPPQSSRPLHIPGYVLPPSSAALVHQRGRELLLEQHQPASTRAVWDEFNLNGRESDLDELDLLLRGLDVRDGSRGAVMSLPDDIPGGLADFDADILTKSRLFEILRDRERQRSYRRRVVKGGKQKVCVFCRNNGEAESTYTSHQLKDQEGKITCPILYIYTCPICGANGPNAHTIKYCPLNPGDTPNIRSLKTSRTSAGKRRIP